MQTQTEIRATLLQAGFAPRKMFGQNFLIDFNLMGKILELADVRPDQTILEIGPGTGSLTEELLDRAARVVAVEIDRGLAGLLIERLGDRANFCLIEGDALAGKHAISPAVFDAIGPRASLVSNLPYNIATPVVMECLASSWRAVRAGSPAAGGGACPGGGGESGAAITGQASAGESGAGGSGQATGVTLPEAAGSGPGRARGAGSDEGRGVTVAEPGGRGPGGGPAGGREGAGAGSGDRPGGGRNNPDGPRNNSAAPSGQVRNNPETDVYNPLNNPLKIPNRGSARPSDRPVTCLFDRLTFTVQREVADRLAAWPSTPQYGPVSIQAALLGMVSLGPVIPSGAFWPRPNVDSRVVRIDFDAALAGRVADLPILNALLDMAFGQRRKQIGSILKRPGPFAAGSLAAAMESAGVDHSLRAEQVNPQGFLAMANALAEGNRS